MDGYSDASFLSHGNLSRAGMTRRDVLRALAAGSTALAGAPLLASFGIGDTAVVAAPARALGQAVDVTLITVEDVPYPGIPTAEQQAADPSLKAYAEAVQPWIDENPGVKLEQITFDVYDQEALLVAISGGTAPSFYPAEVLADWDEELVLAAEKSGLAADVTDQVAQLGLDEKLADYASPIWKSKEVEGRHYALPYYYNCGDGIHYRIDLIKEAGLEEPVNRLDLGGPAKSGQGADDTRSQGDRYAHLRAHPAADRRGVGLHRPAKQAA